MRPRAPASGRGRAGPAPARARLHWVAAAQGAEGWLLSGDTSRPWPLALPAAEARFERALLSGPLLTAFGEADGQGARPFLALLRAPRPAAGRLLDVVLPDGLSLGAADLQDPASAGRAGRALLNTTTPNDAELRAALPMPVFSGVDSLSALDIRLVLDAVIHVPPDGLALAGALLDPMRLVARVGLRRGDSLISLDRELWAEVARADAGPEPVEAGQGNAGFIAYAPLPPGAFPDAVEVETLGGDIGHLPLPAPREGNSLHVIQQFLAVPRQRLSRMAAVMDGCIGPIARGLNRARLARRATPRRLEYGSPPIEPRRSLIIPLHGRLDYMAMQLGLFSARPDPDAEILYILDDPTLWNEAERQAQSCLVRFGLPFSLIDLGANLGYAPANNAGLAAARGAHLCLLNADVFPTGQEGMAWLAPLCDLLDDPTVGAVGPLLLFEDGTVQHDGMAYARIPSLPPWPFPLHPGKGRIPDPTLPRWQEVAAATGACLAVRRADLSAVGGLDEELIVADFEDAALCEALRARGLKIILRRDIVLYHFERQTPGSDAPWRFGATLANASHFARCWNPDAAG